MKDRTIGQDQFAAILQRTARLSLKQRALLDELLKRSGTAAEHEPGNGLRAEDDRDPRKHADNAENSEEGRAKRGALASPLITMRSAGSKVPFFCVHALLGSVFHYHRLAGHMDPDQPFYGLQAPGLDGSEMPLETVDAFAQFYLRAVREVQPKGPYRLGGYSFGSWIAFQMAGQLIEEGDKVDLVAILGTDVPLSVSMPLVYTQIAFLTQYWEDFERNIIRPFLPYENRIKGALGQDKCAELSPLLRVTMAHNKAALRFEPKAHPVKIALFETVDQQFRTPLDASRGWQRLSSRAVETYLVSGNHLSMLDEPHVRDLAAKLTHCLNRN